MNKQMPSWAIEPLNMDEAARALGICRRSLTETIKSCPEYETRGNKKIFIQSTLKG